MNKPLKQISSDKYKDNYNRIFKEDKKCKICEKKLTKMEIMIIKDFCEVCVDGVEV